MEDEIVNSAPSGGAPSEAVSAPVSSPAPASPPASPAAPAAATPTPAVPTPVAPAPQPTRNVGESDDAFVTRFHAWQDAQPKPGDEKPAAGAEPAVDPAKPEAAKPDEPVKPEVKPEIKTEVKPEQVPVAAEPPPSKFAESIAQNEKLMAALDESGVKDEFFDELRTAALGREMQQVFPDVDTAKFARASAEGFASLDLAATELKPGDAASTKNFVQKLMEFSYVLKEDGTPEMIEIDGGNGQKLQVPKTDGTVHTLIDNLAQLWVDKEQADAQDMLRWAESHSSDPRAEKIKGLAEDKLAAIDILRINPDEHSAEEMSEAMKRERAKLDADKQALADSKTKAAEHRFETFRTDTVAKTNQAVDGRVGGWLDQTSLAPNPADSQQAKESKEFLRTSITAQIRDGLYQKFNGDPIFKFEQEQIGRRGAGEATSKALVNHYLRYVERYVFEVANPILTKAGHERVRQSQAKVQKIATQEKHSQMDARAGTKPAMPSVAKVDELQLMRDSRAELIQELKREPTDDEKVTRWRQKMAKGAVAQSA